MGVTTDWITVSLICRDNVPLIDTAIIWLAGRADKQDNSLKNTYLPVHAQTNSVD